MSSDNRKYSLLPIISLDTGTGFIHPPSLPELLYLEDPALSAMQDLKLANAMTIEEESPLTEAELEMRVCHSHLLLVVNKHQQVRGMLGSEDLLGEKPLKIARERKMKRAQIPVRLVMTPREKIIAFSIKELEHAKVGHIVETLHYYHQHYALAIEENKSNQAQLVRGLFSLHLISKQLGKDVTFDLSEAHSLYELKKDLGDK